MLLAVDVGNTHSLFALCSDEQIRASWRVATCSTRTEDELAVLLHHLLAQQGRKLDDISQIIISSVVPDAIFPLRQFARRYCALSALVVGDAELPLPMPVRIDNPKELGADRLVNAYAVWQQQARPAIIIDFGTATTFDVVDDSGAYRGGVIAPGVNLSLQALSRAAARLHRIPIEKPPSVIGTNTTHAMQAGIYYGYLGMVNTILAQIQQERPECDYVVATGGLARFYGQSNANIHAVDPDLTVKGLMRLSALWQDAANHKE